MEVPEKTVFYLCDPQRNTSCSASVNGKCTNEFGCKATIKPECAAVNKRGKPRKLTKREIRKFSSN